MGRVAKVRRTTKETNIEIEINPIMSSRLGSKSEESINLSALN
jgi:imidazoleglycerol phosphate dehydratase HisB